MYLMYAPICMFHIKRQVTHKVSHNQNKATKSQTIREFKSTLMAPDD